MAYYTVVYEVLDEQAFQPEWDNIHKLFRLKRDGANRVCAVSNAHEMQRVLLIEDALDRVDDLDALKDTIGDILGCNDPLTWAWRDHDTES